MTERFELLSDALGLVRGELVAFVGGGGKTGAMLALTSEFRDLGWRVLVSTTTRVGPSVADAMPSLVMLGDEPPAALAGTLSSSGRAFLSAGTGADGKFIGLDPWTLASLKESGIADAVLVEADGARHMPLKAPDEHEPRIPNNADLVVPMAGLDALGLSIEEGSVHRPKLIRAIAGDGVVTAEVIARVLTDDSGGLKDVPDRARVVPLLNKSDAATPDAASRTAEQVLTARPARVGKVVVASLREREYSLVSVPS